MTKFHVRQYRPNFVSGFENAVCRDVNESEILDCPWFKNFRYEGFERFEIAPYGDEKIISACYTDGNNWVAGFAIPVDHLFAENWRYKAKEKRSMLIKYDEDGEAQNSTVEDYPENDDYIRIRNLWHHDAEGVLIPRAVVQEFISALRDLQ